MNDLPSRHHYYVASPYKDFPFGHDAAAAAVANVTAALLDKGYDVFSPIVHGHALSKTGLLRAHNGDHKFWLGIDRKYMDRADALLVVRMDGWKESFGVKWEIDMFVLDRKPIYAIDPDTMFVESLPLEDRTPTFECVDMGGSWRFNCPHCARAHVHGTGGGHVSAHCQVGSPYLDTGYILKLKV